MRCQVSSTVANLLEGAASEPNTRVLLQSRGRVSIKGKGEMETFWLMVRAVPGTPVHACAYSCAILLLRAVHGRGRAGLDAPHQRSDGARLFRRLGRRGNQCPGLPRLRAAAAGGAAGFARARRFGLGQVVSPRAHAGLRGVACCAVIQCSTIWLRAVLSGARDDDARKIRGTTCAGCESIRSAARVRRNLFHPQRHPVLFVSYPRTPEALRASRQHTAAEAGTALRVHGSQSSANSASGRKPMLTPARRAACC